jgi:hypothetical protein
MIDIGRIQVHGNGFAQYPLDEIGDTRLHVWDNRLPRQTVDTSIHNHRFGFVSQILKGTMVNVRLDFDQINKPATHILYTPSDHGPLENNVLLPTEFEGRFFSYKTDIVHEGDSYRVPPLMFHASFFLGTSVTIMRKNVKIDHKVLIACPVGQTPDNTFNRMSIQPPDWLIALLELFVDDQGRLKTDIS